MTDNSRYNQNKHTDPLSVIVDFTRVMQDLLLLVNIKGKELEILEFLISKNYLSKFGFQIFLKRILQEVSFEMIIHKFLTNDNTGFLSLLKMKIASENTNNLLAVLAAKNERISSHFMSIICQRLLDRLNFFEREAPFKKSKNAMDLESSDKAEKEELRRDLLIGLSLFKEYLSSPSLRKDLVHLDPQLISQEKTSLIYQYSPEIASAIANLKPVASLKDPINLESKSSKHRIVETRKKDAIEEEKSTPDPRKREDEENSKRILEETKPVRPKREIDSNLKKLLQMAEKKTLKKVLKEFYSRWVKISEESFESQKNAHIMEKTLNVVEIIVKMRKLDEEIVQQIFKILTELLGSTAHSEEHYIIELVFMMYSSEKGELKDTLMKHIINLPIKKQLVETCYQQLSSSEERNELIDNLVFMTEFLLAARNSFHYVGVRKNLLNFLDKLISLVQMKLIISSELIVRKTVVNLMVELSFFLDQSLFDPILAQFTIEQQALIKIYITKKLSKEAIM